jgi:hypothetical protein
MFLDSSWLYPHSMSMLSPPKLDVNFAEPGALIAALYIRDALGLAGGPEDHRLQLDPPVGRAGGTLAGALVSAQWISWWSELLEDTIRSLTGVHHPIALAAGLESRPDLREASAPILRDAEAWYQGQTDEVHGWKDPRAENFLPFRVMALVRALLRRKDRRRFTTISFLVLPLAGSIGWELQPGQFVISKHLARDTKRFENWFAGQLLVSP